MCVCVLSSDKDLCSFFSSILLTRIQLPYAYNTLSLSLSLFAVLADAPAAVMLADARASAVLAAAPLWCGAGGAICVCVYVYGCMFPCVFMHRHVCICMHVCVHVDSIKSILIQLVSSRTYI
jgi:hypothetical protein